MNSLCTETYEFSKENITLYWVALYLPFVFFKFIRTRSNNSQVIRNL